MLGMEQKCLKPTARVFACAFAFACMFALLALLFSAAPAYADDDAGGEICGYAYLEREPDDLDMYTLVIQKEPRTSGTYIELGAVRYIPGNAETKPYPWVSPIDYRSSIKQARVDGSQGKVQPKSMDGWFFNCYNMVAADLSGLDASKTVNMKSLFNGCNSLKDINLGLLDTSNVTDMSGMFSRCTSLTTLDLEPLDTSNVTNMSQMFYVCVSLTALDLEPLDTSNVEDMSDLFNGCKSLTTIDLEHLETSNVTNMSGLFSGCKSLTDLDLDPLETSNVENMSRIFQGCESLTALDLEPLDTSNVTNMSYMFQGCRRLATLDLEPLDTLNVKNMSNMFSGCESLTALDLEPLDTSSVEDMSSMFSGCGFAALDLSSLDTSNVKNMERMFSGCNALKDLNLESLETPNVKNMREMFLGCSSLTALDFSNFDTASVTDMYNMFMNCSSLEHLNLSSFNTSKVESIYGMLFGCSALVDLDLSGWDTACVRLSGNFLYGCTRLERVILADVGGGCLFNALEGTHVKCLTVGPRIADASVLDPLFNISAQWSTVGDSWQTFDSAAALFDYLGQADVAVELESGAKGGVWAYEEVASSTLVLRQGRTTLVDGQREVGFYDPSLYRQPWFGWKYEKVRIEPGTSAYQTANLFAEMQSLKVIEGLDNFETSHVTNMSGMFRGCKAIEELDLSNLDTSHVTDMSNMFNGCSSLSTIDLKTLNTQGVTTMAGMFRDCAELAAIDLAGLDTSSVTDMSQMFDGCSSLVSFDPSGLDTSSAMNLTYMFKNCSSLSSLDCSGFDVSNLVWPVGMFSGCSGLQELDLYGLDFTNVASCSDVFSGCESLKTIKLFVGGPFTPNSKMLLECTALETVYVPEGFNAYSNDNWLKFSGGMWKDELTSKTYRHDAVPLDGTAMVLKKTSDDSYYHAVLSVAGGLTISNLPLAVGAGDTHYELRDEGCESAADVPWNGRAGDVLTVKVEGDVRPARTAYWFSGCENLASGDLGGLDTSGTTDFTEMFYRCQSLTELDLGKMSTRAAVSMRRMLHECRSLEEVTLGKDFTFRGATMARLAGSELPPGAWQREGDFGRAYASDSIPGVTTATYRRVDAEDAEGLVVESVRGDAGDGERMYWIYTELVEDGSGGYVAENTYEVGENYGPNTLVIGDDAGASSVLPEITSTLVSSQTVKGVVDSRSHVNKVVLGRRVERVQPRAFEGTGVTYVDVRSGKLTTQESVDHCLAGSSVSRVNISSAYVQPESRRKQVVDAFWNWAYPELDAEIVGEEYIQDDPITTELTATKVWNDESNASGGRPSSITLTVSAEGGSASDRTLTLSGDGDIWTSTIEGLPVYDENGNELMWTVHEKSVPNGYTKEENGTTITNTKKTDSDDDDNGNGNNNGNDGGGTNNGDGNGNGTNNSGGNNGNAGGSASGGNGGSGASGSTPRITNPIVDELVEKLGLATSTGTGSAVQQGASGVSGSTSGTSGSAAGSRGTSAGGAGDGGASGASARQDAQGRQATARDDVSSKADQSDAKAASGRSVDAPGISPWVAVLGALFIIAASAFIMALWRRRREDDEDQ